jgi:hypothetical protein
MAEPDRREMQAFLDRPLDDLMEELSLYAPSTRSPADVWNKIATPVHQCLCVDWDYCQVRQDAIFADELDLALVIVSVLAERLVQLPFGADLALVGAIVIKRGMDKFCNCS